MQYLKTQMYGAQEDMIFEEAGRRFFIGAGLAAYVAGGGELDDHDVDNLIRQHRYHQECKHTALDAATVARLVDAAVAQLRTVGEPV